MNKHLLQYFTCTIVSIFSTSLEERKPSSPVPGEQNQQEASRNSKPHINSFQRFFKSLGLKKHGGVGREDNAQCTEVWEILKLNLSLSSRNSKTNQL